MHHPTDRITHTTAFVTPVVEHWLETRNSSMGSPQRRIDPTTHRTTSERSYHGATSRSFTGKTKILKMITSELSEIAPTRCLHRRFLQGFQLLPLDGILQQPLPLGVVLSVCDGAGHDVHILQVHVDVSRKQIGPWDVNFHMT